MIQIRLRIQAQLSHCEVSKEPLPQEPGTQPQAPRTQTPAVPSPTATPHLSEPFHTHSNLSKMQSFSYSEHSLLRR